MRRLACVVIALTAFVGPASASAASVLCYSVEVHGTVDTGLIRTCQYNKTPLTDRTACHSVMWGPEYAEVCADIPVP